MNTQLMVGMVFKGFCNGFFGRDSYAPKRVEAFGVDWIVVRDDDGDALFCKFSEEWLPKRDELIADWLKELGYDE
jgi:hypothetical protein